MENLPLEKQFGLNIDIDGNATVLEYFNIQLKDLLEENPKNVSDFLKLIDWLYGVRLPYINVSRTDLFVPYNQPPENEDLQELLTKTGKLDCSLMAGQFVSFPNAESYKLAYYCEDLPEGFRIDKDTRYYIWNFFF